MKKVAFVGCPNVGKSALINLIAESDLKVGNWSGVTTQKVETSFHYQGEEIQCIDLPGFYGFCGHQEEGRITEKYLKENPIDCLVNVVDSSTIENQFYTTLECRNLQIPMILVLNFEDERIKNGIIINTQKIESRLSLPIISLNAFDVKKKDLLKKMIAEASRKNVSYRPLYRKGTEEEFVHFMNSNHYTLVQGIEKFENQREDTILLERYEVINGLIRFVSKEDPRSLVTTKKIDRMLLRNRFSFIFVFLFIGLYTEILYLISRIFSSVLVKGIALINISLHELLNNMPKLVQELFLDGFLGSIQGLLSILPVIAIFTLGISCLEESGLMARIALIMDYSFRHFHLSGKSSLCFIVGLGCNVPAVLASSSLENEKMRRKVSLLVPFMSCQGRLPIYLCFASLLFPRQRFYLLFMLYGIGILIILVFSLIMDYFDSNRNDINWLELPIYRIPKMAVIFRKVKGECISFFKKTIKVILWLMLVLWTLLHLPQGDIEQSYLAQFAKMIQFIYMPLGFGKYWQLVAGLIPSLFAKEAVIAFLLLISPTLSFLGSGCELEVLSFLIFISCSVPCVMTLFTMKRIYGVKHTLKSIVLMIIVPYLLCLVFYQGMVIFGF